MATAALGDGYSERNMALGPAPAPTTGLCSIGNGFAISGFPEGKGFEEWLN